MRLTLDSDWAAVEPAAVKIKDMHNDAGMLTGFAVSNLFLRRRGVGRIIRSIAGTRIIPEQPRFRFGGRDDFFEFVIDDMTILVIEPLATIGNSGWCRNRRRMIASNSEKRETNSGSHRPVFGLLPS